MASCPKCYTVVPEGTRRCPNCGTAIPLAPSPDLAPSTPVAPSAPPYSGSPAPAARTPPSFALLDNESLLGEYVSGPVVVTRPRGYGRVLLFVTVMVVLLVAVFVLGLSASFEAYQPLVLLLIVALSFVLNPRLRGRGSPSPPVRVQLTDQRVVVSRDDPRKPFESLEIQDLGEVRIEPTGPERAVVLLVPTPPPGGDPTGRETSRRTLVAPGLRIADAHELRDKAMAQAAAARGTERLGAG